jgi:hypothetical protein
MQVGQILAEMHGTTFERILSEGRSPYGFDFSRFTILDIIEESKPEGWWREFIMSIVGFNPGNKYLTVLDVKDNVIIVGYYYDFWGGGICVLAQ